MRVLLRVFLGFVQNRCGESPQTKSASECLKDVQFTEGCTVFQICGRSLKLTFARNLYSRGSCSGKCFKYKKIKST